jgi:hypothetical protein
MRARATGNKYTERGNIGIGNSVTALAGISSTCYCRSLHLKSLVPGVAFNYWSRVLFSYFAPYFRRPLSSLWHRGTTHSLFNVEQAHLTIADM